MRASIGSLAAAACVVVLAACGSTRGKAHGSGGGDPALAFAHCMRANGEPSFPDPVPGGGINIPDNINPGSPAFRGAQHACRKQLPDGGRPRGNNAGLRAQMLQTSICMRQHGVSGFPDPTTSPPPDNGAFSIAEGTPGAFLAVPSAININAPVFKQAARACHFG